MQSLFITTDMQKIYKLCEYKYMPLYSDLLNLDMYSNWSFLKVGVNELMDVKIAQLIISIQ